jgi:antitoxin component YwqK of YwqJK toxin-antitoxin module
MKKLITIAGILVSTIGYNQVVYDHSEYYETVNVGYDTLYKEDGTIRQIGKVSYNSNGERHGEWLIWDDNSVLRAKMFYEHGIRKGEWKVYDQHGHLINSKDYSKSN